MTIFLWNFQLNVFELGNTVTRCNRSATYSIQSLLSCSHLKVTKNKPYFPKIGIIQDWIVRSPGINAPWPIRRKPSGLKMVFSRINSSHQKHLACWRESTPSPEQNSTYSRIERTPMGRTRPTQRAHMQFMGPKLQQWGSFLFRAIRVSAGSRSGFPRGLGQSIQWRLSERETWGAPWCCRSFRSWRNSDAKNLNPNK